MREAKWWKDPKKKIFRSLKKLDIAPTHDAYSRKPTDDETLKIMKKVLKKKVPESLSGSTGIVNVKFDKKKSDGTKIFFTTIGNMGTDPNRFVVLELTMPSKDDWNNLIWAGNVPLEAASFTIKRRGTFTATIAMGAGMHISFIMPPGTTERRAYFDSL